MRVEVQLLVQCAQVFLKIVFVNQNVHVPRRRNLRIVDIVSIAVLGSSVTRWNRSSLLFLIEYISYLKFIDHVNLRLGRAVRVYRMRIEQVLI